MEEEGLVRERKFVSPVVSAGEVSSILQAYCVPDGKYPEGELESIYFDDPMLSSYREKANGDALKRKVRIRWYRGGAPWNAVRPAFLEVKDRIGAARDKARFEFRATAAELEGRPLSDCLYASMLREQAGRAGYAIPEALAPVVAIRYRRRRFVCHATSSRVSVDYGIVCTRANGDVFPAASGQPLPLRIVVCEAKSSVARAWPFGGALACLGFRMESFSKYGYFVERLLQGGFA